MADYQIDNERRISNLEVEVKNTDRQINEMKKEIRDLRKLFDVISEITKNTSIMTSEMLQIKEDVQSMKCDIREIRRKPFEDMEHYKRLVVGAILLAVIAFVMGTIL